MRKFRNLRDDVQRTLRQGTIAAVWGVQILIYPFYLLFQTTRVIGQQLQQTLHKVAPQLRSAKQTIQQSTKPAAPPVQVTADTPIQNTLRSLPEIVLRVSAEPFSTALLARSQLAIVDAHPDTQTPISAIASPSAELIALNSEHIALIAASDPTISSTGQNKQEIRAVASLIETGALVLVTAQNRVLDMLAWEQQRQLQQRIIYELAAYGREQRFLSASQLYLRGTSRRALPLPEIRSTQWLPVRLFRRLMAWMQTSDVAIATNLFHEAALAPARIDGFSLRSLAAPPPYPVAPLPLQPISWNALQQAQPGAIVPTTVSSPSVAASPTVAAPPVFNNWWAGIRDWIQQAIAPASHLAAANQDSEGAIVRQSAANLKIHSPIVTDGVTYATSHGQTEGGQSPNLESIAPSTHTETDENDGTQLEIQPHSPQESALQAAEWVETQAIVVGYEKHPLEQLLQWIDAGMVWIEQRIAATWEWLTQPWQR